MRVAGKLTRGILGSDAQAAAPEACSAPSLICGAPRPASCPDGSAHSTGSSARSCRRPCRRSARVPVEPLAAIEDVAGAVGVVIDRVEVVGADATLHDVASLLALEVVVAPAADDLVVALVAERKPRNRVRRRRANPTSGAGGCSPTSPPRSALGDRAVALLRRPRIEPSDAAVAAECRSTEPAVAARMRVVAPRAPRVVAAQPRTVAAGSRLRRRPRTRRPSCTRRTIPPRRSDGDHATVAAAAASPSSSSWVPLRGVGASRSYAANRRRASRASAP